MTATGDPTPDVTVREARPADADAVAAFTRDTWPDRDVSDYLPDVFPEWAADVDPDRRTLVVDAGRDPPTDELVAVASGVVLSAWEAWLQGLRVAPARRGEGHAVRLTRALFAWARDRGAVVARNMAFSWNAPSLGLSQDVGFDPCTEFRWATPTPDPDADPSLDVSTDPDAAWAFWSDCDARDHLRGLALDGEESWALSQLTRERLRAAADDGRLLAVADGGVRGLSLRNRTYDRETGDDENGEEDAGDERGIRTETWAEYAVGAWADAADAAALFDAVARDAAAVGADRTRVLIPESVACVTHAAAARTGVSDAPDFVLAADVTDDSILGA